MFQTLIAPVNTILQWIGALLSALPVDFYTTTFPNTENPIFEAGVWTNGSVHASGGAGPNTDVRTTTNKAFGTETGNNGFDDSIAVLNGTFRPSQMAFGTVFTTNNNAGDWNAEVEILLRGAITPTGVSMYEFNYSVKGAYCTIVRISPADPGGFTNVAQVTTGLSALSPGDEVKFTAVGSTLTGYLNGAQVIQGTDSTFTSGNPGIGFFLKNLTGTGDITKYGFTSFTAQTITSYRDTSTRFRLAALALRDTATRFRLAAGSFRDTSTRFRLASATIWRNTSTRFRLQSATSWRDTATRFRLASAATVRDTATRFRLQAQAFRDTTTRFRLRAQAFRDTAVRFNLNVPGQSIRDTATRFRVRSATVWRDTAVRYLLQSAVQWRDTATRFRLSAQAYRDTTTRFRLRSSLLWRDTAARFRLSGTSIRDTSVRFNLVQIGGAIRDTALRFRLRSQGTVRDTAVRFRLGLLGVRDTRTRFALRAASARDTGLRFKLSTPGGPVLIASHTISDSALFAHTLSDSAA